jgi:acyl-CoA reductase-like NAD-dependent aldehyde dehydrogenase
MLPEAKLYIDGVLRGATGGKTYDNIGPWTGEVVGKAAEASAEDVNEAIGAARRAFDETDWSTRHSYRLELLTRYRDLLVANRTSWLRSYGTRWVPRWVRLRARRWPERWRVRADSSRPSRRLSGKRPGAVAAVRVRQRPVGR